LSRPAFRVVLLDIEGTITPISFVYDVLFPYARRELAAFLAQRWDEPEVRSARARIATDAGGADFSRESIVPHLLDLMDRDVKATGLKELQGLIWRDGYDRGGLRSILFPDVPPAIRGWREAGIAVCIYSSGSVAAQKVFLAHTEFGDLTPLIRDYFDTTTGAKQEVESYRRIARRLDVDAAGVLFISDVPAELDAAVAAGMAVRLAVRPGNRPIGECAHATIRSLAEKTT
jgi:enolase-phosphatase E1